MRWRESRGLADPESQGLGGRSQNTNKKLVHREDRGDFAEILQIFDCCTLSAVELKINVWKPEELSTLKVQVITQALNIRKSDDFYSAETMQVRR